MSPMKPYEPYNTLMEPTTPYELYEALWGPMDSHAPSPVNLMEPYDPHGFL